MGTVKDDAVVDIIHDAIDSATADLKRENAELRERLQRAEGELSRVRELWIPAINTGGPCPCCGQPEGRACRCGVTLREVSRLRELERIAERVVAFCDGEFDALIAWVQNREGGE